MKNTPGRSLHDPSPSELVLDCISGNIQNRVLLVSNILFGNQLYAGGELEICIALTCWLAMMQLCLMGRTTKVYYDRTKNHIRKFGIIDERFFLKLMEGYPGGRFKGYCELQGIYLAARNKGLIKDFKKLKEKCGTKVIIPNI